MSGQTERLSGSGNSFIDENHIGLLEHLISISEISNRSFQSAEFQLEAVKFLADLENHFSHEEIILKGAGYDDLRSHVIQHRELALNLHKHLTDNMSFDEASEFIDIVRTVIIEHEMLDDQKYWHLFEASSIADNKLIRWSDDLNTGDLEIDRHHIAIANHINRFYVSLIQSQDTKAISGELKLLSIYCRYHFQEEEIVLGESLRPGHRASHENLLAELDVLIDEVTTGKYSLDQLGDYLNYWLLSHIKDYDVPAFKENC